jgi:beta-glucanase (GH16 family)
VHDVYLKWNASSDATSSVTGYQILKDDKFYRYSVDTFLNISKLPHNQSFTLSVIANDLAGNASEVSTISVTTDTLPWEITWRDEFDYTGDVDRNKWNFQTGGDGWGNGEAQYYTDGANASVANGVLTIEARQEDFGSNKFTSTRMNSSGKGDFLYGRIEVRAKLPKTGGTWPAIWTLPTEWVYGGWPDCGEIDIMEHSATFNYGNVFGTIHTGAYNHVDGTQQSGGLTYADVTDTFHTYAMEWYPDHIDWYYDDVIVFTFENEYKTTAEWPFDVKHHLLLNMAIGGGLGGTINFGGEWPQQMIVDYARVYDFKLGENDTIAPEEPQNFVADVDWSSVKLSWSPAKDNHAIDKYYVFVDNEKIDSVVGVSYVVRDLEPLTEYTLGVQAIDLSGNLSSQVSTTVTTTAISGIAIPGKIEAEDFTSMLGVDTQPCEEGGDNVGWIDTGDWLTYTIDVKEDIEFRAAFRVAAENAMSQIEVLDESGAVITVLDFATSGGWQAWKTVLSEPFTLATGIQTIKLDITKGGFNLNWIEIKDKNEYVGVSNTSLQGVSIYPNPTYGNLQVSSINGAISGVDILDITGRVLQSTSFNTNTNKVTIELTDAAIKPGILMVRIHSNNAVFIEKVVYTK